MNEISWPVKILLYLQEMRSAGYVRVTERDLVRQWENLSTSIRSHLSFLEARGMVELSAVTQHNCYIRLTDAGTAFIQEGERLAAPGDQGAGDE
ncbi:MAG: hypothetical protein ACRDIY_01570 [Chloroflexota bacterium]